MGENIGDWSEVAEDSLLAQFFNNGKNISFLGDDFWVGLYASYLNKEVSYYTLDITDLDTNDAGVLSHIPEELQDP